MAHASRYLSELRKNLQFGVVVGLTTATLFSLFALLSSIGGRSSRLFLHSQISLSALIATYFVAGLLGGTVYGVAHPLVRWPAGKFPLGWIIGAIVFGTAFIILGFRYDGPWWMVPLFGLGVGALARVDPQDLRTLSGR
jgi:hypothetical protein